MLEDVLVGLDRQRRHAALNLLQHPWVHEMRHHDVAQRLLGFDLPNDAFHADDAAAPRVPGVLIVVHRELREKQVDPALGQNVVVQPERPRVRAGGRDAGVDELKLGVGEPLLQPLANHRAIAVHLRDRAADECHPPSFLLLKLDPGILQAAAVLDVSAKLRSRRLAKRDQPSEKQDCRQSFVQKKHLATDRIRPLGQAIVKKRGDWNVPAPVFCSSIF